MSRISSVLPAQALESMRASDFDIPSAIGELIDNSIQAEAKHINLIIETQTYTPTGSKRSRELIHKIICADDGYGMDGAVGGVLHNCICMGYSSRYNNRDGIGRFGVGMTYAGIRFATKIEVYSKIQNDDWYHVKFDLKDKEDLEGGIDDPVKCPHLKNYSELVSGDHGTIVIWSNFDKPNENDMYAESYDDVKAHNSKRGVGNYIKMKQEESLGSFGLLNHWIGRTFRKFIWDGVEITLNGSKVYAFDPLYLNKSLIQNPADVPAQLLIEDDIEWRNNKIHLKFTLLPAMYREEMGRGGLDFPGRYIYENEGISIMRANREVFYDHIPRLQEDNEHKIVWGQKDRWWSCEISFDPVLDEYFAVKNIKRGAIPVKELTEVLYHKLKGPIAHARNNVSEYWKEKKAEQEKENLKNPHKSAEDIAKKTSSVTKINAGKSLSPKEIQKKKKEIEDLMGEEEQQKFDAIFQDQPFFILEDHWKGESFIETNYLEGKAVLLYNRNHPYMDELFKLRDRLGENGDAAAVIDLLNILIMSLTCARGKLEDERISTVNDIWDELLVDWGRFLKNYTRTYKLEHPEDN